MRVPAELQLAARVAIIPIIPASAISATAGDLNNPLSQLVETKAHTQTLLWDMTPSLAQLWLRWILLRLTLSNYSRRGNTKTITVEWPRLSRIVQKYYNYSRGGNERFAAVDWRRTEEITPTLEVSVFSRSFKVSLQPSQMFCGFWLSLFTGPMPKLLANKIQLHVHTFKYDTEVEERGIPPQMHKVPSFRCTWCNSCPFTSLLIFNPIPVRFFFLTKTFFF